MALRSLKQKFAADRIARDAGPTTGVDSPDREAADRMVEMPRLAPRWAAKRMTPRMSMGRRMGRGR